MEYKNIYPRLILIIFLTKISFLVFSQNSFHSFNINEKLLNDLKNTYLDSDLFSKKEKKVIRKIEFRIVGPDDCATAYSSVINGERIIFVNGFLSEYVINLLGSLYLNGLYPNFDHFYTMEFSYIDNELLSPNELIGLKEEETLEYELFIQENRIQIFRPIAFIILHEIAHHVYKHESSKKSKKKSKKKKEEEADLWALKKIIALDNEFSTVNIELLLTSWIPRIEAKLGNGKYLNYYERFYYLYSHEYKLRNKSCEDEEYCLFLREMIEENRGKSKSFQYQIELLGLDFSTLDNINHSIVDNPVGGKFEKFIERYEAYSISFLRSFHIENRLDSALYYLKFGTNLPPPIYFHQEFGDDEILLNVLNDFELNMFHNYLYQNEIDIYSFDFNEFDRKEFLTNIYKEKFNLIISMIYRYSKKDEPNAKLHIKKAKETSVLFPQDFYDRLLKIKL